MQIYIPKVVGAKLRNFKSYTLTAPFGDVQIHGVFDARKFETAPDPEIPD
jgi:hypothetical protein